MHFTVVCLTFLVGFTQAILPVDSIISLIYLDCIQDMYRNCKKLSGLKLNPPWTLFVQGGFAEEKKDE